MHLIESVASCTNPDTLTNTLFSFCCDNLHAESDLDTFPDWSVSLFCIAESY
jgi:hypothetical protein